MGGAHGGRAAWPHSVHRCSARHLGPRLSSQSIRMIETTTTAKCLSPSPSSAGAASAGAAIGVPEGSVCRKRCAEGSQRHPSERRRRTGAVSFFTDLRSTKIKEMRRQPRVSLIGYDADAGFQIRLEGKATIDKEGREKAAAWAVCRSQSLDLCTCARCFSATATIGAEGGLRPRRRALLPRAARRGVRPVRWRECAKARPRRVGSSASRIWGVMGLKRSQAPHRAAIFANVRCNV